MKKALTLLVMLLWMSPALAQYTAPNPPAGDNSNRIATTSWVGPSAPILHQSGAGQCNTGHHVAWMDNNWCIQNDSIFQTSFDPSALLDIFFTGTVTTGDTITITFTFGSGACIAPGCAVATTAVGGDTLTTLANRLVAAVQANTNLYNNVSGSQGQILQVNNNLPGSTGLFIDFNSAVNTKVVATVSGAATEIVTPPASCATVCANALDIAPFFIQNHLPVQPGGGPRPGVSNDQVGEYAMVGYDSAGTQTFYGVFAAFAGSVTPGNTYGIVTLTSGGSSGGTLLLRQGIYTGGTSDNGLDSFTAKNFYATQNMFVGGLPVLTSGSSTAIDLTLTGYNTPSLNQFVVHEGFTAGAGRVECENFIAVSTCPLILQATSVQLPNTSVGPTFSASSVTPQSAGSYGIGTQPLPFATSYFGGIDVSTNSPPTTGTSLYLGDVAGTGVITSENWATTVVQPLSIGASVLTLNTQTVVPVSAGLVGLGTSALPFGGSYFQAEIARGAVPTLSGSCSVNTQTGGNTAGTFKANGACAAGTVILTFATTAPTGWACDAHDETTPADTMNQTAHSTTTATFTGTMANLDVATFKCTGF